MRGRLRWPPGATRVLIIEVAGLAVAVGLRSSVRHLRSRNREEFDSKARLLGAGKALRPYTPAGARQKAESLGVRLGYADTPGIVIGAAVAGGQRLYGSLHLDIWGRNRASRPAGRSRRSWTLSAR